jgi:hypothetical protein
MASADGKRIERKMDGRGRSFQNVIHSWLIRGTPCTHIDLQQGLLGIHANMPATVLPDVAKALNNDGDPAPAGLSA